MAWIVRFPVGERFFSTFEHRGSIIGLRVEIGEFVHRNRFNRHIWMFLDERFCGFSGSCVDRVEDEIGFRKESSYLFGLFVAIISEWDMPEIPIPDSSGVR